MGLRLTGRLAGSSAVLVAVAACSGGKAKPRAIDDARRANPAEGAPDASPARDTPGGAYRVDPDVKTGDVQLRVEWKDIPSSLRAPGATTPCGTPAAPAVAPTVTWGIPDVFVAVEVDRGKAFAPPAARVVLDGCALVPRVVVAGPTLILASAAEQPVTISVDDGGAPRTLQLPIAGHAVALAVTPGSQLALSAPGAAPAAVVVATTPYVAVTEATGQVIIRDVPIGTHPVRAWLPARAGSEPRERTGTVTVTAGGLAEVTLDLGRP